MNLILKHASTNVPLLRVLGDPQHAIGDDEAEALVWLLEPELGWALARAHVGGRLRPPAPALAPARLGAILARSCVVEEFRAPSLARQIAICLRGAAGCRVTPRWLVVAAESAHEDERADLEFLLRLVEKEDCEWLGCSSRDRISRDSGRLTLLKRRLRQAGARLHVPSWAD
jgi:hypothetical protein